MVSVTRNSGPQTLDTQTAKALFYIGLIILMANIIFFYSPIASFFLILLCLFVQKRWKIQNQLRVATFLTILPLLLNLSIAAFKQLLILTFLGIASLGSDVYVEFSNVILNYFIPELLFWMISLSITVVFGILLFINIIFPIYNKILRIIFSSIFLISMIAVLFLSFMSVVFTFGFVDFSDYLKTGQYRPVQLVTDKNINDYHIRVYRTDYEGALGSIGIEVKQEKDLPFGLRFVRDISNYYRCADVQLTILGANEIQILPDSYGSNFSDYLTQQYKNPEELKKHMINNYQHSYDKQDSNSLNSPKVNFKVDDLPQIVFTLKPFHTTQFFKFFKNRRN